MNTENQNKQPNNSTKIYIEVFENLKEQKEFPAGLNSTMYWAYEESKETNQ